MEADQILVRVTTANDDFEHPEGAMAVAPSCVLNSRRSLLTQPAVDNRCSDAVNVKFGEADVDEFNNAVQHLTELMRVLRGSLLL